MVSFNPIKDSYMQAGGASVSFGSITAGGYNQGTTSEFNPNANVDTSIFEKSNAINTKVTGVESGSNIYGENNPFVNQPENTGLVDRLNRIDQNLLKPDSRDEFHGQNIYLEG